MTRICYLGAPSEVYPSAGDTIAERLKATGGNTGNLLIGNAVKRHLKAESIVDASPVNPGVITLDPAFVSENFDYVVIGASNFIFKNFDFGYYADFLEKIKLPIIIIGLGAQSPSYNMRVKVTRGTERLLRIISERSTSLGVRGNFTASVLNDLGIKNLRVIGCPSIYWTCRPELMIRKKILYRRLKISVNGSANVVEHAVDIMAAKRIESGLANMAVQQGFSYILQNESALMEIASNPKTNFDPELIRHLIGVYGLVDISEQRFVDYVRSRMMTFFSVESWMNHIRKMDFVIGTRFHGCLIAILVGVPSFMFVHDSRTREMCEILSMPHADIRDVDSIDVYSLYRSLDLKSLKQAYTRMYKEYVDFLEENGIEHVLPRTFTVTA